jgi:peptidoglycan/xylan/chitin deacetylase (PgdA/CDA1 family)
VRRGPTGNRVRGFVAFVTAFSLMPASAAGAAPALPDGCRVDVADFANDETGAVEHGARRGNRVALTFDESLGPNTRPILEALQRANDRATFFTVGDQIRIHRSLVERIVSEGHEHGNHSFNHPHLTELDTRERLDEMRSTQRLLRRAGGFEPCLMRPPFGSVDESVVDDAARIGLGTVMWDVAGGDFLGWSDDEITSQVLSQVRPGSIVLLHQLPATARAVPDILDGLEERGLRSVPVVKLLGGRITSEGRG